MNLPLKTSLTTAIELVANSASADIELLGCQPLKQVSFPLKCAVENKDITCDHSFKNVFGSGVAFFYTLEQVRNEKVIRFERGIGSYYEKDNKSFLKRDLPIAKGSSNQDMVLCHGGCSTFDCSDCDHIVAYSSYPQTYAECLPHKNSIITSIAPFVPASLVVEEDSLLGRLDGDLTSIPLCSQSFLERIIELISSFTKQIILKTSKLDVKKIATNTIQLNPHNKAAPKKGCIIYDNDDDNIKYYDGSNWRTLTWQKDDV